MAFRSHSIRSMAASKALISGVALQEVCDAAGWSSPHTFIRFYYLNLDSRQVPKCSRPSAVCYIWYRTGTRHYGGVILTFPIASKSKQTEFPWKWVFGYDCNLGSVKKEQTLRPRPYLLRACRRLAQTLSEWQFRLGRLYSFLVRDVTRSDVPLHLDWFHMCFKIYHAKRSP